MLHVHLFGLVAREGEIEVREQAVLVESFQLFPVEEIELTALIAEEQPSLTPCPGGAAVLQKCTEGSDARPGTDHHDRDARVGWQLETMSRLDEYRDRATLRRALGQKARGHALAHSAAHQVAHRAHREMHFPWVRLGRRRNRIEPRLQPSERQDQLLDR